MTSQNIIFLWKKIEQKPKTSMRKKTCTWNYKGINLSHKIKDKIKIQIKIQTKK